METSFDWGQPTPNRNSNPACWDLVTSDIKTKLDGSLPLSDVYVDLIDLVTKLIVLKELDSGNSDITIKQAIDKITEMGKSRDDFGFQKYGVRLQPFNGRDFLADAIEEALDLLVYFRGKMFEIEHEKKKCC